MASRTAGGHAVVGRAHAAIPMAEPGRLLIVLQAHANAEVLRAVTETGSIAVVFTQPTTHRSFQVKAADAVVTPPAVGWREAIERHARAFALELREIGFTETFIGAYNACDADRLAGITFTCASGFDQAPGPHAGEPVPT
ncbi:hypothetical protein [Caenispirillum salinarum]|uniref:hypothetical protein n=1 Tax=Caenispirillum salinarum TaxID=859058 RepID=UPI001267064C|nr:hypothetical protein [Caenispirillum salinarum]